MTNIMIYSRKSKYTGKGESIENQVEMCKEYAQRQFGKDIHFSVYEDEGFSGKNTIRPEFQRMLGDIRAGGFHVLMCYRLDRISRSVSDFSGILEELQGRGVDFVSIKENFDTTTPMGRAMIQIASVFAELERETIAERIRDNKYKQYRNGHWQGGIAPLGYESVRVEYSDEKGDKRSYQALRLVPEHAELVRLIFDKYISLGSYTKLETYLLTNRVLSPRGYEFGRSGLRLMLGNPVYAVNDPCVYEHLKAHGADMANGPEEYDGTRGLVGYGKTVTKNTKLSTREPVGPDQWIVAVADHKGIVPGERWVYVQTHREEKSGTAPRAQTSSVSLLSGLIRCKKCGSPMELAGNRIYADGSQGFYYTCFRKRNSRGQLCDNRNIQGPRFDAAIVATLKEEAKGGGSQSEAVKLELSQVKVEQRDYTKKIRQIEGSLAANAKSVKKLATKLAASDTPEADALIYEAMHSLQAEAKELNIALSKTTQEQAALRSRELGYGIVREAFDSFARKVDTMTLEEKREVLHKLIRRIFWDGREATMYLATVNTCVTLRLDK